MIMPRYVAWVAAGAAALTLSGCGSDGERDGGGGRGERPEAAAQPNSTGWHVASRSGALAADSSRPSKPAPASPAEFLATHRTRYGAVDASACGDAAWDAVACGKALTAARKVADAAYAHIEGELPAGQFVDEKRSAQEVTTVVARAHAIGCFRMGADRREAPVAQRDLCPTLANLTWLHWRSFRNTMTVT
ncbi:hypothetical protein [Streptomyces buecherae]|uniref:hypothetical protein n=1 Tax=Streptomyces buecherae TaxID=2763006 RepID=UPI0037BB9A3A